MSTCTVIMVSYHTGPVLFASVKSVLRQQQLAELIVVDNGNPPDVLARLQQMALSEPRLKLLTGGGNIGFARACNLGAKKASGEYLLLLKPDCLLPPEALGDLMHAFGEVKGATLAGCWLLNPDGSTAPGVRRTMLTPVSWFMKAIGLQRLLKRNRPYNSDAFMPRETHPVPAISGACMCMRRIAYDRLGGLDENFFLYLEDYDLCMRVQKTNGVVICVPQVKVTRMRSRSGATSSRFVEWQKTKGVLRYFSKHFQNEYLPGALLLFNFSVLVQFILKTLPGRLRGPKRAPVMSQTIAGKRLMVLASGLAELQGRKDLFGKTVLVTGATSQVGLCVLRRLIASGAAVLAISRSDPIPFAHEHLRWIKGDLTDEALHLQGYLVDMVVHCAPLWHLPPTLDLLSGAEVKRIIAFGSTSIFGKALSNNMFEKEIVEKLANAEREIAERCDERGIQWTILRPTMIYGVGLDLSVTSLAKFIDRFGFFPVYPPAFGRRQPVHADDLALAVLQAASTSHSIGRAYNVSGGEVVTYRQMLERLFGVCRKKTRIIETTLLPFILDMAGWFSRKRHINGEIARRMNDDLIFFHDDARKDFGFNPRPFLSGGMKDIEGF